MLLIPIIAGIILLIILFLLNFYRDPSRRITKGNFILSAADGTVISIQKTSKDNVKVDKGFIGKINVLANDIGKECHVVSVFMSPFDVHINRAPIDGVVKSIKHTKGKFFNAGNIEKSLENENNQIIIENKKMKVKVIQIAGFLARRVKCSVNQGQKVNKGGKIGMISLGSQTTLIMPVSVKVMVKLGQKVKAGITIIAKV